MKRSRIDCGPSVKGNVLHPDWKGKEFASFGLELRVSGGRQLFARRFRDAIGGIEQAVHAYGAATLQVPDGIDMRTLSDQWDPLKAGALAHVWHTHQFGKTREMTALALPHDGQRRAEATLLAEGKDLATAVRPYADSLLEIVDVNPRQCARSQDEFQDFLKFTHRAYATLTNIIKGATPSNEGMTALMFDLDWIATRTGRHSHLLGLIQSINETLAENRRVFSRRLAPGEMLLMSNRPLHAREVLDINEVREERPSDIIWFSRINGKPQEMQQDNND